MRSVHRGITDTGDTGDNDYKHKTRVGRTVRSHQLGLSVKTDPHSFFLRVYIITLQESINEG